MDKHKAQRKVIKNASGLRNTSNIDSPPLKYLKKVLYSNDPQEKEDRATKRMLRERKEKVEGIKNTKKFLD